MRTTIKNLVWIILILTPIGFVDAISQDTKKNQKDKNSFYLYGGLNWKSIYGSGLYVARQDLIDPTYPHTDSALSYPCLSPHIGAHYNFEIIKSLNLRVGVELNVRKDHYQIYRDSISKVYYPVLNDVRNRSNYYNIEIPAEIAYNIRRFGFGIGAKFIVYELRVDKSYYSDELDGRRYSHSFLFDISQHEILYPNVFLEYLAFQNPEFPIWLKATFEYGGDYSSTIVLSLKTKL